MGRKPVHLVFVEEKNKGDGVDHNKFYDMFERNGECHCLWGRRQDGYEFGKSGKLTVKPLYDWDKIYASKIAKGYEDYSHLYTEVIQSDNVEKDDLYAPIPDSEIASIVNRLQRAANDVIKANYSVKSGQVTKIMVDETQKIIDKLTLVTNLYDFNNGLIQIFKIIPRSMSRVDNYLAQNQNQMIGILKREQDLLDVMRGQIITPVRGQKVKTKDGNKKTILELNGITMEKVESKDIEIIKRKMGSHANELKGAWKVCNLQQKKNFDAYKQQENIRMRDTKLLWHGTRTCNVFSILKTGLVLRPVNVQITGKMFGKGIYFSPTYLKSRNYTSLANSYWAKGTEKTGFMILHEVAYGKPYDVYSFDSKYYNFDYSALRRACPGAHCLHAHGGTGMLRNDEIVVYKEEQLSALYLVEIGG